MFFHSDKAKEIIHLQKQMDSDTVHRVKASLAKRGVILEQSAQWDKYLISRGVEALTYSDGTMVMHTKVSASGFFEELIHYGQIRSGRASYGDEMNLLLMEIEAKERLIKNRKGYSCYNKNTVKARPPAASFSYLLPKLQYEGKMA